MNWFCSQIGAREHYAVARALRQTGRLSVLYTDFWAGPLTGALGRSKIADGRWKLGTLRSLAARYHPELQDNAETLKSEITKAEGEATPHPGPLPGRGGEGVNKTEIVSWNLRALWWEILRKRKTESGAVGRHLTPDEAEREKPAAGGKEFQLSVFSVSSFTPHHGFIEVGRRFATCVREDLKRRKDLMPGSIFYAYDTGALEAFEWCREQGIKCVLNQMDPNRVEVDLVRAEEKLWPGWVLQAIEVPEPYFARREREWALADRIVVNSEFSRQALLQQGVPPEKLTVIPLCYELKAEKGNQKSKKTGGQNSSQLSALSPLRVLFLGQVILRKGIQYLIAAAKQMEKANIHFDIVGPVGISDAALATAPSNMTFHGRITRDQAAGWYQRADLFVLPTLSDGFALTQLEAMANGLPVIATPCCGEVVSDGVDGFMVSPRDAGALARTLQHYLAEPELLRYQSAAALKKSRQFTIGQLAASLMKLEGDLAKRQAVS